MKNIYKRYHTIEDVIYINSKVILVCLASIDKFNNIKGFWSSVFGNLKFIEIHREDGLVRYHVELDKDKNGVGIGGEEFYAVLKNGKKERVWKPLSKLQLSSFPDGYAFTFPYVNLYYEKKSLPRNKFFTPILSNVKYTQDYMKLSGYLFIPSYSDYDLSKFVMKLSKFRQEDIMIEFPFKLTLPKDSEIFGIFSSDIFSKFTKMEVFLFDIEIPLAQISLYSGIFNIVIENSNKVRLIQNYYKLLTKEEKISTYNIDI